MLISERLAQLQSQLVEELTSVVRDRKNVAERVALAAEVYGAEVSEAYRHDHLKKRRFLEDEAALKVEYARRGWAGSPSPRRRGSCSSEASSTVVPKTGDDGPCSRCWRLEEELLKRTAASAERMKVAAEQRETLEKALQRRVDEAAARHEADMQRKEAERREAEERKRAAASAAAVAEENTAKLAGELRWLHSVSDRQRRLLKKLPLPKPGTTHRETLESVIFEYERIHNHSSTLSSLPGEAQLGYVNEALHAETLRQTIADLQEALEAKEEESVALRLRLKEQSESFVFSLRSVQNRHANAVIKARTEAFDLKRKLFQQRRSVSSPTGHGCVGARDPSVRLRARRSLVVMLPTQRKQLPPLIADDAEGGGTPSPGPMVRKAR